MTTSVTLSENAARRIGVRRGISGADLALLTRQFATLVRAGLTLEECLNALIEQTEKARTRHVLAGVRGRMLEGQSLARSLAAFPQAFPDIYRVMVDAGEQLMADNADVANFSGIYLPARNWHAVMSFVWAHGGDIALAPAAPGEGATVVITL